MSLNEFNVETKKILMQRNLRALLRVARLQIGSILANFGGIISDFGGDLPTYSDRS